MGRWSVIGGDMVPAVMAVLVRVVSMTSIRVVVLWRWSYLVGVVITVWRLFSVRKLMRVWVGVNRSRLRSPCIVVEVDGYFSWILVDGGL